MKEKQKEKEVFEKMTKMFPNLLQTINPHI